MKTLSLLLLAACLRAEAPPAELALDARGAAMGGACGACYGAVESLWGNPAGLGGQSWELAASSLGWADGLNLFGAQAFVGGDGVAFAAGIKGYGVEDQSRDSLGRPASNFQYKESTSSLGIALGSRALSGGVAFRQRELSWSVAGVSARDTDFRGMDLGLQAALLEGWRGGLAMRGWELKGTGGGVSASPITPAVGGLRGNQPEFSAALAWTPGQGWLGVNEWSYDSARFSWAWKLGLEQTRPLGPGSSLSFRSGWRSDLSSLGSLPGFSLGLGLNWTWYRFDYAFSTLGDFGLAHRATLSLSGLL